MDYQQLSREISKPTSKWSTNDVQAWLNFIGMANLVTSFTLHKIDGSCLQALDANDLESQIGIKSKIARKKIMRWIQSGFNEFNQYLLNKMDDEEIKDYPQIPIQRISTSMLRERIKPQNIHENDLCQSLNSEMIVTTYEGPHANFYTIGQPGSSIGRSQKNSIVVLEESAAKFHAQLKYITGKFYIKDLGTLSGTFIKVFQKQFLKLGMIIEMGSFQFIVVNINFATLQILLRFSNMANGDSQNITINLNRKRSFSFGRKNTNDFNYDDQHLSGIHAKISYLNGNFILEDMSSTNGTWIRIGPSAVPSQYFQLYHGCVFKIGTTSTYICKFNKVSIPTIKRNDLCSLCKSHQTNCLLVPCKHSTTCFNCSQWMECCPVCKIPIEQKVKIFK